MGERIRFDLARGAVYTYASMVLLKAILLVNSVVISRWLGPENLGVYSVLSQVLGFAVAFGLFGLPLAASRFVAEYEKTDRKKLEVMLSSLLTFSLAAAGLLSTALFFASDWLAFEIYKEARLAPLIRIGAFVVFLSLLVNILKTILQGLQKIVLIARLNVAIGITGAFLTLLLVVNFTLTGVVLRDAAVAALTAAVMFYALRNACGSSGLKLVPGFNAVSMRGVFSLAGPVFLGSVFIYAGDLFIRSHLALQCGFARAGFFSISDNFFQMVYFIPQAIAVPLLPIIAGMHSAEPRNYPGHAASVIKLTGAIVLPVAAALALASGPAVRLLYGEVYTGSLTVVFIMVFSAAVVAPAHIAGQVVMGAGRGRAILLLSGLQACVNVSLAYLLINKYGLNGLGAATLVSSLVSYSLSGLYVIKRLGIKPRQMRFGTYQAALLLTGSASYFLTRSSGGALFALSSSVFVCGLAAAQYLSLSDGEKELLRGVAGRVFARS